VIFVTTIKATEARVKLFQLLDQTAESHEPIQITGKRATVMGYPDEEAAVNRFRSNREPLENVVHWMDLT
jgi:PHD/YefM family antitoxin component YafN of YafNO toxin-antitoxin module